MKNTSPVEPKTSRQDYVKRIREREAAEKKRKEKWSKEFKQKMNSNNYTPIFNSTQNYNSTGQWSNITIADHTTTDTTLHVDGTLEVKGRDVLKELDEMRDALLLLKRDVDMEAKYPKLKELKDAYEAQLEKYKTWEALK